MEFRDLKKQYKNLKKDIDAAVTGVIEKGCFISGPEVEHLEQQLAEYAGVKHCVTCGNGTDALWLALMAWNVGKNDAVFVPDFTFFASAEAPAMCDATPVFVDVERDTFNISATELEKAIKLVLKRGELTPRVIVTVDLFGQPADYIKIRKIADKYGLLILEDGAQGFGGAIGNKKACSFGDISTTSFFPAKPLGCYGDGGAIFTDNDEWEDVIRSLCIHGKGKDKYDNVRIGMNSRLDTLQAAILKVKLKAFKEYELLQVNKAAALYTELLKDFVTVPVVKKDFTSSWAQYTIVLESTDQRNYLRNSLKEKDIPAMIYYEKVMHEQKAFESKGIKIGEYENTMYLKKRVLSLPIHSYMDKAQVECIADIIISVVSNMT